MTTITSDLNSLNNLIKRAKTILNDFEESLQWKKCGDRLELSICPRNNSHIIPKKSCESHARRCYWRSLNYSDNEIDDILDAEAFRCSGPQMFIDDIIAKIAPGTPPLRNHEIYVCTLTREERLQIYCEVVAKFHQNNQNIEDPFLYKNLDEKANQSSSGSAEKSNIEVIKELRDHKRRRQSYRAKNVHVTKRSQTEVLRDILSIHMEELRNRWNPQLRLELPNCNDFEGKEFLESQDTGRNIDQERNRESFGRKRKACDSPKSDKADHILDSKRHYDSNFDRDPKSSYSYEKLKSHNKSGRSRDKEHHRDSSQHRHKSKKHKHHDDRDHFKYKKHKRF